MKNRILSNQNEIRDKSVIFGGLLGVSVFTIIQMITLPELDNYLLLSLGIFSISIPFLASELLIAYAETKKKYTIKLSRFNFIPSQIGIYGACSGVISLVFHLSPIIGVFCVFCVPFAALYTNWVIDKIENVNYTTKNNENIEPKPDSENGG